MARTKISIGQTVVLRKGEDLSDGRYEACTSRPLTGFVPGGIRGTVIQVDTEPTSRAVEVHFPAAGVTAWFAKRSLKIIPQDR